MRQVDRPWIGKNAVGLSEITASSSPQHIRRMHHLSRYKPYNAAYVAKINQWVHITGIRTHVALNNNYAVWVGRDMRITGNAYHGFEIVDESGDHIDSMHFTFEYREKQMKAYYFKGQETVYLPAKVNELPHHKQNISFTTSGYGEKIPTVYMVQVNKRWRRMYARTFGNSSTTYITVKGEELIIQGIEYTTGALG